MSKTRRWLVLATVSAGLLMVSVDTTVLYTALPRLTSDLQAGASQKLWIINAYPLVMAGLLLGAGTLGDRIGHKRMYLTGLVLFAAASLLAAFAASPPVLIGARGFLAVGAAAMLPATLSLIRITFDDEHERGIAIGIWGTMAVLGAALGPIVGGLLLQHFWWGSVFLLNILLTAVYTSTIHLPATAPAQAAGGIDQARAAAGNLPAGQARTLLDAAARAFDNGYTLHHRHRPGRRQRLRLPLPQAAARHPRRTGPPPRTGPARRVAAAARPAPEDERPGSRRRTDQPTTASQSRRPANRQRFLRHHPPAPPSACAG